MLCGTGFHSIGGSADVNEVIRFKMAVHTLKKVYLVLTRPLRRLNLIGGGVWPQMYRRRRRRRRHRRYQNTGGGGGVDRRNGRFFIKFLCD